jgi:hypothetical protein
MYVGGWVGGERRKNREDMSSSKILKREKRGTGAQRRRRKDDTLTSSEGSRVVIVARHPGLLAFLQRHSATGRGASEKREGGDVSPTNQQKDKREGRYEGETRT